MKTLLCCSRSASASLSSWCPGFATSGSCPNGFRSGRGCTRVGRAPRSMPFLWAPSTRSHARSCAATAGTCSLFAPNDSWLVVPAVLPFVKAHAYGNDFLYIRADQAAGVAAAPLAPILCDRHRGIGADGLVFYSPTPAGVSMELYNADGSRSEVSGNGVRGLAAILLRHDSSAGGDVVIHTEAGQKRLTRTGRLGSRQTFVAAMGAPRDLRQVSAAAGG